MKLAEKERGLQRRNANDGTAVAMFVLWAMPMLLSFVFYMMSWETVESDAFKAIGFALLFMFPIVSLFMIYGPYYGLINKRNGKKHLDREERERRLRKFSIYLLIPSCFNLMVVLFFVTGPMMAEIIKYGDPFIVPSYFFF